MINLAIPSIFIKRLRHMFEQLRRVHKAESKRQDQLHMAQLLTGVNLDMEVRLDGSTIFTRDLLDLRPGDVLMLNHPLSREAVALVNGSPKFRGDVTVVDNICDFKVSGAFQEE